MPRNPVDWAILAMLLFGALAGARRGLVASALGAVGSLGAFAASLWLGPLLLQGVDAAWHLRPRVIEWLAAHGPLPAGLSERASSALRAVAAPALAGSGSTPGDAIYPLIADVLLRALAVAAVYAVAAFLLGFFARPLLTVVRGVTALGLLDRAAGAALGCAEATLTAAVALAAATSLAAFAPGSAWAHAVDGSAWGQALVSGLDRAVELVQQHFAQRPHLGG